MTTAEELREGFRQGLELMDRLWEFIDAVLWDEPMNRELEELRAECQAISDLYHVDEVPILLGVMADAGVEIPPGVLEEVARRG